MQTNNFRHVLDELVLLIIVSIWILVFLNSIESIVHICRVLNIFILSSSAVSMTIENLNVEIARILCIHDLGSLDVAIAILKHFAIFLLSINIHFGVLRVLKLWLFSSILYWQRHASLNSLWAVQIFVIRTHIIRYIMNLARRKYPCKRVTFIMINLRFLAIRRYITSMMVLAREQLNINAIRITRLRRWRATHIQRRLWSNIKMVVGIVIRGYFVDYWILLNAVSSIVYRQLSIIYWCQFLIYTIFTLESIVSCRINLFSCFHIYNMRLTFLYFNVLANDYLFF